MSFKILGVRVSVSFLLIAMLALFSFYDETGIALCALFAALLHESGHIIAAALCGCKIKELAFKPFGIRMRLKTPLSLLDTKNKLIVLSAGCAVNLACFFAFSLFSRKITDAALVHLITAFFNLLPAGTLDGGRILYELMSLKYNDNRVQLFCDIISLISASALFILGSAVLVKTGYNVSLMITAGYLFLMVIVRQKKLK
ncbi:MAG: hypothetical protein UHH95_01265 [Oscillospiraceae bacterium]|nr:hypothetical protein [Oscillospiraceae bacterium]